MGGAVMPCRRPAVHRLADLLGASAGAHAGLRVSGIATDSRQVRAGDLFFARPGLRSDGRAFIAQAVAAGAVAVVVPAASPAVQAPVPVIAADDLPALLGRAAARLHGDPSARLRLVGVTGTNGKTTVSHLLASVLDGHGGCGVIGTLGHGLAGQLQAAQHTTPEVTAVQASLAGFVAAGAANAVMEVSSHGIAQGRIEALHFHAAVYTNLSRDHLDYHGDMDSYAATKQRLFSVAGLEHVVLNADDAWAERMARTASVQPVYYTLAGGADDETLRVRPLPGSGPGLGLDVDGPWGRGELHSRLVGHFNAANLAAALTTLLCMGLDMASACDALGRVPPAAGRMQWLGGDGRPVVVVDFAHTPDALRAVLEALAPLARGRLLCVFGCGGDRDRGKRPEMAAVAERLADQVVITDDNPRSEASALIIDDILTGLRQPARALVEPDRARAIHAAVTGAGADDVVLVAGKGHEPYQEREGVRRPFSDVAEAQAALAAWRPERRGVRS